MVVLSLGVRPDRTLVDSFVKAVDNVLVVGDDIKPGRVSGAVHSAFHKAYFFKVKSDI